MKKAFTLLEIIMVIVILGIISSISSDIIIKIYQSYQRSSKINELQSQTELVLEQLGNRLANRIKGLTKIVENSSGNDEITWTGYNYEGFLGGWNGFCDLNESNATNIVSTGSNMAYADSVIATLSQGGGLVGSKIYFKDTNLTAYDIQDFTETNLTISNSHEISEQYYISWSDYTVKTEMDNNLTLYFGTTRFSPLAQNVTRFKVKQVGQIIRIKLCLGSDDDNDFSFCKEKAIY